MKRHLKTRLGNFDSKFGWHRDVDVKTTTPLYTLWQIHGKLRFTVTVVGTRNTPRDTFAEEIKLARMVMRKFISRSFAEGDFPPDRGSHPHVKVSRFKKGEKLYQKARVSSLLLDAV